MCLHLFGIMLLCKHQRLVVSPIGLETPTVRTALSSALHTLKVVGRASLMSRKARVCLRRFLEVFDSMGKLR